MGNMEPKMDYWPGYAYKGDPLPRTLRFCKVCRKDTTHEIRSGAGLTAKICMTCMDGGHRFELDRDCTGSQAARSTLKA
jgi:hypothetical protein